MNGIKNMIIGVELYSTSSQTKDELVNMIESLIRGFEIYYHEEYGETIITDSINEYIKHLNK